MTRLLIDLQCCQGESDFQGIGRYVLNLTNAIINNSSMHGVEVHLLLNSIFGKTVDTLKQHFREVDTSGRIHVISTIKNNLDDLGENGWQINGLMRDLYIAGLNPDVVLDTSPFGGFNDDCAIGVHKLSKAPVVSIAYDFVPFLWPDPHLKDPLYRKFCLERLESLKKSNGIVCISKSVMREASEILSLSPDNMVLSYGAADSQFRILDLTATEKSALRTRFGLGTKFITYCGAIDERKNLCGLIKAIEQVPADLREECSLVVIGKAQPSEVASLRKAWADAGMSGSALKVLRCIGDEELVALYNTTDAFVFPSFHEEFGLPALEAIRCGAPTIVSTATSLPEVVAGEFATFDPASPAQMAELLDRALSDVQFREKLIQENLAHSEAFSWETGASATLDLVTRVAGKGMAIGASQEQRSNEAVLNELETLFFSALSELDFKHNAPSKNALAKLARSIMYNRRMVERAHRSTQLPDELTWRIEGPYDSTYSLAIVNRELARALHRAGHEVKLLSSEGAGDFEPDEGFLKDDIEIGALQVRSCEGGVEVTSRLMFPPRVDDIEGGIKILHCFGWEESGFPQEWINQFNMHLDGITTMSEHVSKILRDNGIDVPVQTVGIGVDHFLNGFQPGDPKPRENDDFEILHVSSCFPRKGVDVLLRAYAFAFQKDDGVRLRIKTFRNPHNTIDEDIAELRREFPDLPHIEVIYDDLSDADLRSLYLSADVVVLPSRAEGFCLPIAEAILAGTPVIATGWSGQMDFARLPMVKLLNFTFKPARTHMPVFDSYWAEPDVEHLVQLLDEAKSGSAPPKALVKASQDQLLSEFTWAEAARRSESAVRDFAVRNESRTPRVGIVSTFNTKCGIAEYTVHLSESLATALTIFAPIEDGLITVDPNNVVRCWRQGDSASMQMLFEAIAASRIEVLVFQFNHSFFEFQSLRQLIFKLKKADVVTIIQFHSTDDYPHPPERQIASIRDALYAASALIVHTVDDLNNLRSLDLVESVSLIPLGLSRFAQFPPPAVAGRNVTLATYGFFLPQKGLLEVIRATERIVAGGKNVRLIMVNAEHPNPISKQAIDEATDLVGSFGLRKHVDFHTNFLEDHESIRLLQQAHAIIYPYRPTQKSASLAVRHGLASGRPVVVTPIKVFDDLGNAVVRLPGITVDEMADGLDSLVNELSAVGQGEALESVQDSAVRWRNSHYHDVMGRRYSAFIRSLANKHFDVD